jgi:hypothetical protein
MRKNTGRTLSSILALASFTLATTACLEAARAEPLGAVVVTSHERVVSTGPNRALLRSGVVTLGVAYVPALVVAIERERKGDDYLYYPVVGPWLDLSHREPCATCEHETLNDVLLVTDGVFQGVGALQIVGSFLFPERRSTYSTKRHSSAAKLNDDVAPRVQLKPARFSGGYGLQATALF